MQINTQKSQETLNEITKKKTEKIHRFGENQITKSLLHDNVRPLVQRKSSFGWDVLNHPSHSPDLASSDYHLFTKLKEHLGGKHFCDDDEMKIDV
ncbi:SETMR methyltransferase, partial [Acromyrmex charruanus]